MSSPTQDPTKNPFADDDEETQHPLSGRSGKDDKIQESDLGHLQQKHWNQQDEHLDALSASLNRQHEMSVQMNEELDLHHDLLEEFDADVEQTGLRIGGASNQLDRLRKSLKDHWSMWALGSAIILLIILIAAFK